MAGLASFVLETSTNPGTGSFTLNGAAADRVSFATAFPNGGSVYYFADDGTQAEWGVGTLTVGSPNTLARTTIIGTTAGSTSALKFSGRVNVYCEVPGERLPTLEADGSLLIGSTRSDRVKTSATVTQIGYSIGDTDGFRASVAVTRQDIVAVAPSLRFDIKAVLSFASAYTPVANDYAQATLTVQLYHLDANGNAGNALATVSDIAICTATQFAKLICFLVANGLTPGDTYSIRAFVAVTGAPSGSNPAGRLSATAAAATML